MVFHTNCRWWRGDKPCRENRLCEGCSAFQPLGPRLLVIKLGARGDVLRTTPLIAGLRRAYPDAHLTWLTAPESTELLQGLPSLDRVLAWSLESAQELLARPFELLVCLDKEPWALGLAERIAAREKRGWGLAPDGTGTPRPFTPEAEYSLALGVSDELKFRRNLKTYPEIIFEAAGLQYRGEPYAFSLTDVDRQAARAFLKRNRVARGERLLGLFTGSGAAFANKSWTPDGFAALARRARRELKARVLLLGGPQERRLNARIRSLAKTPLLDTRGAHTLREFAGLLEACRVVVTGDTVALHLALAVKRPVVALFGPTVHQEIGVPAPGEKLVSPAGCAPCYRRECDKHPNCMEQLDAETVWQAVRRAWLGAA
ncbi:MAG: glycosyltransferase family 9 protein [candidate division FCPU426 bacterium]